MNIPRSQQNRQNQATKRSKIILRTLQVENSLSKGFFIIWQDQTTDIYFTVLVTFNLEHYKTVLDLTEWGCGVAYPSQSESSNSINTMF